MLGPEFIENRMPLRPRLHEAAFQKCLGALGNFHRGKIFPLLFFPIRNTASPLRTLGIRRVVQRSTLENDFSALRIPAVILAPGPCGSSM